MSEAERGHPGIALRLRREALRMTRRQLSEASRVDSAVIQLVELGEYGDGPTLVRLGAALDEAEKKGTPDVH